jgi:ubiquinone/menaquinone biosynthesis C-methylase UbiE
MTAIAKQGLSPFAGRAKVVQSDGSIRFPLADKAVDRVVSTYVLDLLSEDEARQVISEAYRVLKPGGRLCLASLTYGSTLASRIVSSLWQQLFRLYAPLLGGCRPIRLDALFDQHRWTIDYRKVTVQFAVPSEVIIASPRDIHE